MRIVLRTALIGAMALMPAAAMAWFPFQPLQGRGRVVTRTDDMLQQMKDAVRSGDHVVFMSNGGFDAAPRRFCQMLEKHERR